MIHKCTSNPKLLQNFRLSVLYAIPTWEKEVFTSLATLPHAFCKSTKHGVGRACQILHSAAPQHNSIGDATSTAEEPATGGVKAMCSLPAALFCTYRFFIFLTSQPTVNEKSKTENITPQTTVFLFVCF